MAGVGRGAAACGAAAAEWLSDRAATESCGEALATPAVCSASAGAEWIVAGERLRVSAERLEAVRAQVVPTFKSHANASSQLFKSNRKDSA